MGLSGLFFFIFVPHWNMLFIVFMAIILRAIILRAIISWLKNGRERESERRQERVRRGV